MMGVHKKQTIQLHFLMLPPCDCIAKIVNNFIMGTTFENQMTRLGGGNGQFNFLVMEKIRAEQCRSKMGDHEDGVN